MIRFLANENVPVATVEHLRNQGFDVISVSSAFPSIKDEAVILFASMEHRTILTFDRDYGEFVFKHGIKPLAGIIHFRLRTYRPVEPAEILLKYLNSQTLFEGQFTVISEDHLRQRKI